MISRLDYIYVPPKDAAAERVCLLTPEGAGARAQPPDQFLDAATSQEQMEDGALFRFKAAPDAISTVDAFIREEMECCPFFSFERWREGEEVVLRISTPQGTP